MIYVALFELRKALEEPLTNDVSMTALWCTETDKLDGSVLSQSKKSIQLLDYRGISRSDLFIQPFTVARDRFLTTPHLGDEFGYIVQVTERVTQRRRSSNKDTATFRILVLVDHRDVFWFEIHKSFLQC